MSTNDSLPDDVETLKRLLLASNAELAQARAEAASTEALVVHLRLMIEKLKRDLFGARNERKARLIDQMELQLEELEAAATEEEIAAGQAVAASSRADRAREVHLPELREDQPGPGTVRRAAARPCRAESARHDPVREVRATPAA